MSSDDKTDLIFRALAARVRRSIMDALKDAPQTTGDLCAQFSQLNRCTVMQHLGVLEEADLVLVRRVGRQRWNYLNALPIKHIHERWIGGYASGAVALLDRLKTDLETETVA